MELALHHTRQGAVTSEPYAPTPSPPSLQGPSMDMQADTQQSSAARPHASRSPTPPPIHTGARAHTHMRACAPMATHVCTRSLSHSCPHHTSMRMSPLCKMHAHTAPNQSIDGGYCKQTHIYTHTHKTHTHTHTHREREREREERERHMY